MAQFQSLGGVFTTPPQIVPWGEQDRFLFAFAVGRDQALWYAQLDGFGFLGEEAPWSAWQSLGGFVTSVPHAVRSGVSSVDVFAVGAHSELLHWQFRDNAWTRWPLDATQEVAQAPNVVGNALFRNWESLGGILMSPPHAVMFGQLSATIVVFALGTDHAFWTRARESVNGPWRDWDTLGHTLSSPPHAVTLQRETFAVFGLGTDSAIWYTTGSDWRSLGGTFSSAPYAVSTLGHIHVFAADTQSALKHRRWNGNSWSDWESLGGILMSSPTADSFEDNEMVDVFAVGTDSAIWRRQFDGGSWKEWHSLGSPFTSPPGTVTRRPNPVGTQVRDLVALRTDHAVWYLEEVRFPP
jgi:hypothetical protein